MAINLARPLRERERSGGGAREKERGGSKSDEAVPTWGSKNLRGAGPRPHRLRLRRPPVDNQLGPYYPQSRAPLTERPRGRLYPARQSQLYSGLREQAAIPLLSTPAPPPSGAHNRWALLVSCCGLD